MELKTFIFIGKSGCGKGTQADKLMEFIRESDDKGIFYLESGHRFRDFIESNFYASKLAGAINREGGLQPAFLSVWAWGGELIKNLDENEHLVIDGTPRRQEEAVTLESAFDFYQRPSVDVIYINVSNDWSKQRLLARGREDDVKNSSIESRLEWFENEVMSVVDFYKNNSRYNFHEINGEQTIEEVHLEIMDALELKK